MRNIKNKKGFTLVELVVVVAIISILSAVAVPITLSYISSSRRSSDKLTIDLVQSDTVRFLQRFEKDKRNIEAKAAHFSDIDRERNVNIVNDLFEKYKNEDFKFMATNSIHKNDIGHSMPENLTDEILENILVGANANDTETALQRKSYYSGKVYLIYIKNGRFKLGLYDHFKLKSSSNPITNTGQEFA